MRMYPLLLVAAVTLSAYADASLTRSSSTFERPPSHQHKPQRFLRDGAETSEEERIPDLLVKMLPTAIVKKYQNSLLNKIVRDTGDNNLLKNSQYLELEKIMKRRNSNEPEVAIAKLLASRYTDDDFLKILEKSTNDPATKTQATKLQDGWITSKENEAGVPTDKVTQHALKLINLDDNVLSSSRFDAYFRLMKRKYDTNADELNVAMAIDLGYRYGDNDIAFLEMLEKPTKDLAAKDLAKRIQDGLLQLGINANATPYDMLKMLHLQNYGHNVLSTPRFKLWAMYVERFYKDSSDEVVMKAMAMAMAHRRDNDFLKTLIKSKEDPATEDLATKLQDGWKKSIEKKHMTLRHFVEERSFG